MSQGENLYVRKSSEVMSDTEDQMWDDSSMTAAYDKAVSKANAEIAQQIAMATNTKPGTSPKEIVKTEEKKSKSNKKQSKQKTWKEGMACRAVYVEDGKEYEAHITAILDHVECVVKFLGYENSEIVTIQSLKPSRGEEARLRQVEGATGVRFDDGFESQSNEEASAPPSHQGSKKTNKKASKQNMPNFPNMPSMPNMPNLPNLQNIPNLANISDASRMFSLPSVLHMCPPPPALLADEDDALSSMLIAWYMAGYHAGLYQGVRRAKENRRH